MLSYSVEESGQKGDWDHNLANRRRLIRGNKKNEFEAYFRIFTLAKSSKLKKSFIKGLHTCEEVSERMKEGRVKGRIVNKILGEDLIWKRRRKASTSFPRVI